MKINVRSDVNRTIRQSAHLRDELLRAAAKAVNETATTVRKAAIDETATRNPSYSKETITGYITLRKAVYKAPRTTKGGQLRKNYAGISATITAAGKAPNLIYFIPPAARRPDAWRQGAGVAAHVAGKTSVYEGTFVVRTKSGKMVVVARSAKAKRSPHLMRPKGNKGKWLRGWSKGIYGPPINALAANAKTIELMNEAARKQWPISWQKFSSMTIEASSV